MTAVEMVIVPAWRRADFLHATLTRLAVAVRAYPHPVQVWVTVDRGHTPDVAETVRECGRWFAPGGFTATRRIHHPHKGNSCNVLHAYAEAVAAAPTRIHLVEEDVFVAVDYFSFTAAAWQLTPDVFAVSACRNQHFPPDHQPPPDPDTVYRHPGYQSLAVSFPPARLAAVLPHVCADYLTSPVAYCRRTFPTTAIPAGNAEQDGLIGRIIEAGRWEVTYPGAPRAYHAGFVGYNRRGMLLHGPIPQRAARLLSMTADELNTYAKSYPDHTTVDLDGVRPPPARVTTWP